MNESNYKVITRILTKMKEGQFSTELFEDAYNITKKILQDGIYYTELDILKKALKISVKVREYIVQVMKNGANVNYDRLAELAEKFLLLEAPYLFDSYMQYLEKDRPVRERFYLPRRKKLKVIVDSLQEIIDDELDELFISLPPRVGKTTLLLFFVTWVIGRDSEKSNLYSAYSDIVTSAFYNGIIEIISDELTYAWKKVFPNNKLVRTNAKDGTMDINRKKRYHSLTSRSLYGTLNGACDCNGILIADDLISGIEEAMNKDRLAGAWLKVANNLLPRAKEQAKKIWIGTRWSLIDPIGLRIQLIENSKEFDGYRYKVINQPALDIFEESNFDYAYGVGYSTDYYLKVRASFEQNNDMASWLAQYQGEPIEREGALFTPDDMRYFNGVLPEGEADRIFMACDVAWGGGDFVAAPILYQYGDDIYCPAVIFDDGDKYQTRPRVVEKILQWKVRIARFEKNNGGDEYKEYVENELKLKGYRLNITSKSAPTTKRKQDRILSAAPEIREIYFLEPKKRDKEYNMFMQNLFAYTITGKVKNDDAPDSLAMGIDMKSATTNNYSVFHRPF